MILLVNLLLCKNSCLHSRNMSTCLTSPKWVENKSVIKTKNNLKEIIYNIHVRKVWVSCVWHEVQKYRVNCVWIVLYYRMNYKVISLIVCPNPSTRTTSSVLWMICFFRSNLLKYFQLNKSLNIKVLIRTALPLPGLWWSFSFYIFKF
jgi:hypothetical protein